MIFYIDIRKDSMHSINAVCLLIKNKRIIILFFIKYVNRLKKAIIIDLFLPSPTWTSKSGQPWPPSSPPARYPTRLWSIPNQQALQHIYIACEGGPSPTVHFLTLFFLAAVWELISITTSAADKCFTRLISKNSDALKIKQSDGCPLKWTLTLYSKRNFSSKTVLRLVRGLKEKKC